MTGRHSGSAELTTESLASQDRINEDIRELIKDIREAEEKREADRKQNKALSRKRATGRAALGDSQPAEEVRTDEHDSNIAEVISVPRRLRRLDSISSRRSRAEPRPRRRDSSRAGHLRPSSRSSGGNRRTVGGRTSRSMRHGRKRTMASCKIPTSEPAR